jgi:hypothetical protein
MKKINNFINKAFEKQIDATGLAVFRIAYCLILLCEIGQMFYFRHLIFDEIPYLRLPEISSAIPIIIWFLSVVFVLLGCFTRTATIINYILTVILIGTINSFEYHVFYAYLGINFLLMFMPINQVLSIDRLFKEREVKKTNTSQNLCNTVSQIYYFLPLYIGIALVYFDSVFFKLSAKSWINGLGVWFPASLPMMVHNNLSLLLNIKHLNIFLGYLTLIFEASFIFLFFRKNFRLLLLVIGVGLHVGILFIFPIPWFALTVCAIYLLLIPVFFWNLFNKNQQNSDFPIDKVTISSKNKIIKVIIIIFTMLQLIATYNSPVLKMIKKRLDIENTFIDKTFTSASTLIGMPSKILFGITGHGVFIDRYHYNGYNHIIAIVYQDNKTKRQKWLPIINKNGQPSYYNYGSNWRKMSFSTNAPNININILNEGIRDFTAFWAYKNNINLDDAKFLIKVKKIDSPKGWEKDFLNKQIAKPWIDGGYVEWKNKTFNSNIKNIEAI